jgi:hypothetical protein
MRSEDAISLCVVTIEKALAKGVGCRLGYSLVSRNVLCSASWQRKSPVQPPSSR